MIREIAGLLLVTLPNEGHWISGRQVEIRLERVAIPIEDRVHVEWCIAYDGIAIDIGQLVMKSEAREHCISLTAPSVRTAVSMQIAFVIRDLDELPLTQRLELSIWVYPDCILDSLASLSPDVNIITCETSAELTSALGNVPGTVIRVQNDPDLAILKPDIVVVGPDFLGRTTLPEMGYLRQAERGAVIIILVQERCRDIGGRTFSFEVPPPFIEHVCDHPLLADLNDSAIRAAALHADARPIILAEVHEGDQPIIWFPIDGSEGPDNALKCLLDVFPVGRGAVIASQLPFGPIAEDPRAQLFLRNAVFYSLSESLSSAIQQVPASMPAALTRFDYQPHNRREGK